MSAPDALPIFSVESLWSLPTIHLDRERGMLKVAMDRERIWLVGRRSCCLDHVTVERLVDGRWQTVLEECHG